MNSQIYAPRLKVLKVLVVDDEPSMRKVIKTILAAIGIPNVLEADDGLIGFEMARSHLPDLILVDWEMPLVDGPQLVQRLRAPHELMLRDTPIIMLSAHSDMSRVVESARIGVNEFVRKPVSIKTLQDRIIAIIGSQRPNVKIGEYYGPMPRRIAPIE